MKSDRISWLRSLWHGATAGARAWSAYAVLEHLLLMTSWLRLHPMDRPSADWRTGPVVLAIYTLAGALAGLVLAPLLKVIATRRVKSDVASSAAGVVALSAAFQWHLITQFGGVSPFALSVGVLISAAAIWLPSRVGRTARAPWVVAGILLATGWLVAAWPLTRSLSPPQTKWLIGVAALVVVACRMALDGWITRTAARRGAALAGLSGRVGVVAALAAAVLLVPAEVVTRPSRTNVPAGDRPNVVLIVMDTVRADHLSLYGYGRRTSPNLERFAAEATTFTQAYAAGHMTLTTHASLMTGLYPPSHGAVPPRTSLQGEYVTFAETAARVGYRTVGVVANHAYLHPDFGVAQGFRHWDYRAPTSLLPPTSEVYLRNSLAAIHRWLRPPPENVPRSRSGRQVTDAVIDQIDALRAKRQPFVLFVNYMDAHEPYAPEPPFDRLFPGKDPEFRFYDFRKWWYANRGRTAMPPAALRHMLSQYDGAVASVDYQIGRVFDALRRAGAYHNSLIVVTSDHGEAFGEHDKLGHELTVFQETARIPLVVKWPHVRKRNVVHSPVSTVDIAPTIYQVLGGDAPKNLPGIPLSRPVPERPVLVNAMMDRGNDPVAAHALIAGTAKLIVRRDGRQELYDVKADPHERVDLSRKQPELAATLRAQLDEWLEEQDDFDPAEPAPEIDAATLERLKALGYVQ